MNTELVFSLIKRDFKYGFRKNYLRYIVIIIFFSTITFLEIMKMSSLGKTNGIELFYNIYKGTPYYINIRDIEVPFMWCLVNCFCSFLIGDYVYKDIKENGVYILTRAKKVSYFWISKIIYIITNVLLFYLTIFSIAYIFGKLFNLEYPLYNSFFDINISTKVFLGILFTLYITTSIAICQLQVSMSLLIKPLYAYGLIMILIFISAFAINNLLPGQHSLLLRHVPFDNVHKLTTYKSLIYNFILFILSTLFGYIILNKKDIR